MQVASKDANTSLIYDADKRIIVEQEKVKGTAGEKAEMKTEDKWKN